MRPRAASGEVVDETRLGGAGPSLIGGRSALADRHAPDEEKKAERKVVGCTERSERKTRYIELRVVVSVVGLTEPVKLPISPELCSSVPS